MNEQKPVLSKAFTVEDIHRLREYNQLRRKGMTAGELNEDTRRGAELFLSLVREGSSAKGARDA